jgi:hypothetical protein
MPNLSFRFSLAILCCFVALRCANGVDLLTWVSTSEHGCKPGEAFELTAMDGKVVCASIYVLDPDHPRDLSNGVAYTIRNLNQANKKIEGDVAIADCSAKTGLQRQHLVLTLKEPLREKVVHAEIQSRDRDSPLSEKGSITFTRIDKKIKEQNDKGAQRSIEETTAAEKKEFIELLRRLPAHGEFFTDDSVKQAAPKIRVLLALTPSDIGKDGEIYPYGAVSRGLCDVKEPHDYALRHFAKIAHPQMQLLWAVMLFDIKAPSPAKTASPEIVAYLKAALKSKEQAKMLEEMTGPEVASFKKCVEEAKVEKKTDGLK